MFINYKIFKNILFLILTVFVYGNSFCQYAPSVGQVGTTAIYKDSSVFVSWAKNCILHRGYQDISDTSLGYTTVGDSLSAIGQVGNGVVSLGDGGYAILTFNYPIKNGTGWDFAVFENSFNDTFLELAFVEVSSDGVNYFRFHSTSLTQNTIQIDNNGVIDATKINNLAGKYRAMYGTPFDLEELKDEIGLDVNNIQFIKIIDVVGCIQNTYCSYDFSGNIINDPWSTPFISSGFDLDAVGVIHQQANSIDKIVNNTNISIYPNPVVKNLNIFIDIQNNKTNLTGIEIIDITGKVIANTNIYMNKLSINTKSLQQGVYFIHIYNQSINITKKLIVL